MATRQRWNGTAWEPATGSDGGSGSLTVADIGGLEPRLTALEQRGYEALLAKVVGDGVADDRQAIQDIIDAGYQFGGWYGGKFRYVGCLFYDKTSLFQQPVMEPLGELIPENMPQVQEIDGATGANIGSLRARVGIAVGWKRTAWDRTTNVIKMAQSGTFSTKSYFRNSPTDGDGSPAAFELRNCTIRPPDGTTNASGHTNAIVVQSIVGGLRFRNVKIKGFRSLATNYGYTDLNTFDGCHSEQGDGQWLDTVGDVGTSLMEQSDYGDAISFRNCKSNSAFIAKLNNCRGAHIEGYVTGRFRFTDCEDIHVVAAHDERNIESNNGIEIIRSGVTLDTGDLYARDTNGGTVTLGANIIIDDDNGNQNADAATTLLLRNIRQVRRIESSDQTHGPLIHFLTTHPNTQVIAEELYSSEVANLSPGQARKSPLYFATGVATQITTALADKHTQLMIASGRFVFSALGGVWAARNLNRRLSYEAPTMVSPLITGVVAGGNVAGSLGTATAYSYAFMFENAPGRTTSVVSKTVTTNSNGAVKIDVGANLGASLLYIWRSTTDAVASPSHYIVVPARDRHTYGFDLGATVFGLPWRTASIPARPSSASSGEYEIKNGVEKAL